LPVTKKVAIGRQFLSNETCLKAVEVKFKSQTASGTERSSHESGNSIAFQWKYSKSRHVAMDDYTTDWYM